MNNLICLVPIYQNELKGNEKKSFDELNAKLTETTISFISPADLDTTWYEQEYPECDIVRFQKWHKNSLQDYNDLMLATNFYERFREWSFLFIFQTDARFLGTEEQLISFTKLPYDYWGAPWGREGMRFIDRVIPGAGHSRLLRRLEGEVIARVGNGGVSLRRTSAISFFLAKHRKQMKKWEKAEDLFIGYYGAKHPKTLRLPDVDLAYQFAAEMDMEQQIKAGQIPMAVHKWENFFPDLDNYI